MSVGWLALDKVVACGGKDEDGCGDEQIKYRLLIVVVYFCSNIEFQCVLLRFGEI